MLASMLRQPLAIASLAALLVTSAVSVALTEAKYGCEYRVGGEAGNGLYLCPDGTFYAMPLLATFALVFALVLIPSLGRSRRRGRRRQDPHAGVRQK